MQTWLLSRMVTPALTRIVALMACSLVASSVNGALVIDVGSHDLLPNTAGQTIEIFVVGGDLVQGLNFNAQIADGGFELGGIDDGPALADIDILTGTIFAGNNTGADDPEIFFGFDYAQLELRTTTTSSGSVAASGLLATIAIDTTGYTSGTWDLYLGSTLNGPTDFAGIPVTITEGSITIVPEAGSAALVIFGMSVVLLRRKLLPR